MLVSRGIVHFRFANERGTNLQSDYGQSVGASVSSVGCECSRGVLKYKDIPFMHRVHARMSDGSSRGIVHFLQGGWGEEVLMGTSYIPS
jgi:hypothetical protein